MPVYEYEAVDAERGCEHCRKAFEVFRRVGDPPPAACPKCGAPVRRVWTPCGIGASKSALDSRAKSAGFHKLVKRDKGTYEKSY